MENTNRPTTKTFIDDLMTPHQPSHDDLNKDDIQEPILSKIFNFLGKKKESQSTLDKLLVGSTVYDIFEEVVISKVMDEIGFYESIDDPARKEYLKESNWHFDIDPLDPEGGETMLPIRPLSWFRHRYMAQQELLSFRELFQENNISWDDPLFKIWMEKEMEYDNKYHYDGDFNPCLFTYDQVYNPYLNNVNEPISEYTLHEDERPSSTYNHSLDTSWSSNTPLPVPAQIPDPSWNDDDFSIGPSMNPRDDKIPSYKGLGDLDDKQTLDKAILDMWLDFRKVTPDGNTPDLYICPEQSDEFPMFPDALHTDPVIYERNVKQRYTRPITHDEDDSLFDDGDFKEVCDETLPGGVLISYRPDEPKDINNVMPKDYNPLIKTNRPKDRSIKKNPKIIDNKPKSHKDTTRGLRDLSLDLKKVSDTDDILLDGPVVGKKINVLKNKLTTKGTNGTEIMTSIVSHVEYRDVEYKHEDVNEKQVEHFELGEFSPFNKTRNNGVNAFGIVVYAGDNYYDNVPENKLDVHHIPIPKEVMVNLIKKELMRKCNLGPEHIYSIVCGHEHGKVKRHCHFQICIFLHNVKRIFVPPGKITLQTGLTLLYRAVRARKAHAMAKYCQKDGDYLCVGNPIECKLIYKLDKKGEVTNQVDIYRTLVSNRQYFSVEEAMDFIARYIPQDFLKNFKNIESGVRFLMKEELPPFTWTFPEHMKVLALENVRPYNKIWDWFVTYCLPTDMERRKALVIYSEDRALGKSKFVRSLVPHPAYLLEFTATFTKEALIGKDEARLLHLEDMSTYTDSNRECWKQLCTSQSTSIRDAYVNFLHPGGIPCIITTNNFNLVSNMFLSAEFNTQVVIVDLDGHYIGPDGTRPTQLGVVEAYLSESLIERINKKKESREEFIGKKNYRGTSDKDKLIEDMAMQIDNLNKIVRDLLKDKEKK